MRRHVATVLLLSFLAPWLVSPLAAAHSLTPCPMHSAAAMQMDMQSGMRTHGHASGGQHNVNGDSSAPADPASSHGCNCIGDCGRTASQFALIPAPPALVEVVISGRAASAVWIMEPISRANRLLPFATGPPAALLLLV